MPAMADTYRIATYAAPLSRDGPGLLLRDITNAEDLQIIAVQKVIAAVNPDVLILTDFDYDYDSLALATFAAQLDPPYPYQFALQPNAGMATGHDLDGNGRTGDARDAQGYGRFAGDGGMAILSRITIDTPRVSDHSAVLWRDLAGATLPMANDMPFLSTEAIDILRLSSTGHWIVPIVTDANTTFSIMAFSATPPVFDGPEDMNGLRNKDELLFWRAVLDGEYGLAPERFIVAGNANLDPNAGAGYSAVMADFLADPRLQDPLPDRNTANWPDGGPGKLRVSYVLPSANLRVTDADVYLPAPQDTTHTQPNVAGPHHLVWVDIAG